MRNFIIFYNACKSRSENTFSFLFQENQPKWLLRRCCEMKYFISGLLTIIILSLKFNHIFFINKHSFMSRL